ncbi:MAG: rod shape-determining protein MreD [Candidatus Omnitrophota bacterium]|jgi:rod shape-determining protein MreD
MKKLFLALVLIALATIQLNWPSFLVFFNNRPDLLLAFAIASAFRFNFRTALLLGLVSGLLKDAFLPSAVAVNTFTFGIWVYLVFRLSSQISTDNDYVRLAVMLIVALLNNLVLGFHVLGAGSYLPAGIFLRNLVLSSIYTGAVFIPVMRLSGKVSA